ncbi:MAG: NAD(P)H-dependent oxidoreductase subunit E, partial [Planctomycetota bacterium]
MNHDELERIAVTEREEAARVPFALNVCLSAGCQSAGAEHVFRALRTAVDQQGLGERCRVRSVGCLGPCASGPCVASDPASRLFGNVSPADVPAVLAAVVGETAFSGPTCATFLAARELAEDAAAPTHVAAQTNEIPQPSVNRADGSVNALHAGNTPPASTSAAAFEIPVESPFFTRQRKIVLENSGRVDPERIEEYIANGGYRALLDTLREREPAEVVR